MILLLAVDKQSSACPEIEDEIQFNHLTLHVGAEPHKIALWGAYDL